MRSNKLLLSWAILSVILISISLLDVGNHLFLSSIIFIILSLILLTYLKTRELQYISRIILGATLFSVFSMISLMDNYFSAITENQDGISISNKLAYLYIGGDGWTIELFRSAYEKALLVSVLLIIVYILLLIIDIGSFKKKSNNE